MLGLVGYVFIFYFEGKRNSWFSFSFSPLHNLGVPLSPPIVFPTHQKSLSGKDLGELQFEEILKSLPFNLNHGLLQKTLLSFKDISWRWGDTTFSRLLKTSMSKHVWVSALVMNPICHMDQVIEPLCPPVSLPLVKCSYLSCWHHRSQVRLIKQPIELKEIALCAFFVSLWPLTGPRTVSIRS